MSFVAHFNYWIVVALMMVGLYVVFASANMVKRLIGLGLFQTSVFLFYISLGKVAGGIPPILPEHDAHGGGHGDHHDAGHAATAAAHGVASDAHGDEHAGEDSHAADAHAEDGHGDGAADHAAETEAHEGEGAHDAVADAQDAHAGDVTHAADEAHAVEVHHGDAHHGVDGVEHAAEILYSNPLPHVLILTAIVVGVATLAVGLALVVRIREAYGTIEDDEINRAEYDADIQGADA